MTHLILAIILFVIMYVLLLIFADYRWITVIAAAAVFVIVGILPLQKILPAINWNVIMMLAGTMVVVAFFIESQMPVLMATKLLKIVPNVKWAVVMLSLFSGLISAFVDNVATVLMVAPIGLAVSKKLKINPVPVIISIAVSSNLQGAATLVGDTTSILLGGYAHMSFNDFFWFQGRPGIFFAVELGALLTVPVLLFLFRKETEKVEAEDTVKVTNLMPTFLMAGVIVLLIAASQFPDKPELTNGFICCGLAIVGLVYETIRGKSFRPALEALKTVDYKTLILLAGLFIVIEGVTEAGVINKIAEIFVKIGGSSILLMYILIVVVSVVLSAFIDNIPYVATMLPVVQGIAMTLHADPNLLYFGLLIGATLGGNITPVGASANITGIGILQKEGYKVSTKDFMRIGVPFTLIAATAGAAFIWIFWS